MATLKNSRNLMLYTASTRVTGATVVITSGTVNNILVPKGSTSPSPTAVTLTASATGYTNPSYSWSFRYGDSATWTALSGATNTQSVTLNSTWLTAAGTNTAVQYKVVVTETASGIGVNQATYILNIPILREGADGFNNVPLTLYKRTTTNTAPSLTTQDLAGTSTYNFTTAQIVGQPTGWTQTIPSSTQGPYLWAIQVSAVSNSTSYSFANTLWSTPVLYAQDGSQGTSVAVVYAYKRSSTTPTDNPGPVTYDFTVGAITSNLANSWSKTIPSGTDPLYVLSASALATSGTTSTTINSWSSVSVLAQNGSSPTVYSIYTSSPVIVKDSASAASPGTYSSISIQGKKTYNNVTTNYGWVTVTADGDTESTIATDTATSPFVLSPASTSAKNSYTIKLYSQAQTLGAQLLDTQVVYVVYKGTSPVLVSLANQNTNIPASSTGAVTSTANTGNTIQVFEGITPLTYDNTIYSLGPPDPTKTQTPTGNIWEYVLPTIVDSSYFTSSSELTSFSPTIYSGTLQPGDRVLVFVSSDNGPTPSTNSTGWSLLAESLDSVGTRYSTIFEYVATTSGVITAPTISGVSGITVYISYVVRNVSQLRLLNTDQVSSSQGTIDPSILSTLKPNSKVLLFAAADRDYVTTINAPTGYNLIQNSSGITYVDSNILKSTDQGLNYTAQYSAIAGVKINSVAHNSTSNLLVAVGSAGAIFVSTDSGQTWAQRTSPTTEDLNYVIYAASASGFIAVGNNGTIITTTSSTATTWTLRNSNTTANLYSANYTPSAIGLAAVGSGGTLVYTTLTSVSAAWVVGSTGVTSDLNFIGSSSTTLLIAGNSGTVLKSTTGYSGTWTNISTTAVTSANIYSIAFVSTTSYVAVGSGGTIVNTTTSGSSWVLRNSGTTEDLKDIYYNSLFAVSNRYVVVGNNGTVLYGVSGLTTFTKANIKTALNVNTILYNTTYLGGLLLFGENNQRGQSAISVYKDFPDVVVNEDPSNFTFTNETGAMAAFSLVADPYEILEYQTIDTSAYANGKFDVVVSYTPDTDSYITLGQESGSGTQEYSITDFTANSPLNAIDDLTLIYTLYGNTTAGVPFTSSVRQKILKVKDGLVGQNGFNTAVVYLYARNNSVSTPPQFSPTETLVYSFVSGTLTGTLPNGWVTNLPDISAGTVLWAVTAPAFANTTTYPIQTSSWSVPKVLTNSQQGNRGTLTLYSADPSYSSTWTYSSYAPGPTSYAAYATALIQASANGQIPSTPTIGDTVTFSNTTSAIYQGSMAGYVLTVTGISSGTVSAGQSLTGTGIASGTTIVSQISGTTGGTGTYAITISQTVASTTITATKGSYVYTITYTGTEWKPPGTVIDGSLLVTGTVTASKINSNGLDIRDNAGNTILSAGNSAISGTLSVSPVTGAGFRVGDLWWDASGNAAYKPGTTTYGKGVALTPGGILAHNGTNTTFSLNASTGDATFSGIAKSAPDANGVSNFIIDFKNKYISITL